VVDAYVFSTGVSLNFCWSEDWLTAEIESVEEAELCILPWKTTSRYRYKKT